MLLVVLLKIRGLYILDVRLAKEVLKNLRSLQRCELLLNLFVMKNKDFKDILLNINGIINIEYTDVEFNANFKVYIVRTKDNKAFLLNEEKQKIENSLYDSIELNYPEIVATKEGDKFFLKLENGNLIKSAKTNQQ
jgi:hypothetical protein